MDEAIRQLNVVTSATPKTRWRGYLQAQAFRMKGMYADSIDSAQRADRAGPQQRRSAFLAGRKSADERVLGRASREYQPYLRLSDFNSKLAGKLNYYVLGFLMGMGKKKRAAQQDIWRDLRSLALFGICDSKRKLTYDEAITYCQRGADLRSGRRLHPLRAGLKLRPPGAGNRDLESLAAANKHFRPMLDINAHMAEADYARKNMASINNYLPCSPSGQTTARR